MDSVLRGCLEDLERRIDADDEERLLSEWRRFADGGHPGEGFAPRRAKPSPPGTEWPRIGVNPQIRALGLGAKIGPSLVQHQILVVAEAHHNHCGVSVRERFSP